MNKVQFPPPPMSARITLLGIACILLCLMGSTVHAQRIVTGKVIDAQTKAPINGATYTVATANNIHSGVLSDEDGNFFLRLDDSAAQLTIRHIGYKSYTFSVPADSTYRIIALEPTTTELNEVVVTGYESNRRLLETAGSVALLTPQDLERFSNASLVPAMNTIPGVRMEERSPGSYRLSIRGSLLRSPFGVRNVKVYWNDLPFTDPGGNTYLNLLDFQSIGRIEVIKGPTGSIYGAGTGGTILLHSPTAPTGQTSIQVGGLAGSYGLRGVHTSFLSGTERSNTVLTYAQQQADGYREHTNMRRDMLNWRSQFIVSKQRTVSVNGFYSDLFYQTPGGLTQAQVNQNPRMSRPAGGPFRSAREQQAGIYLKTFNLGVSHQYQWSDKLSNSTSVYGMFTDFANPFITNYERKAEQNFGARTRTTYELNLGPLVSRITAGGEFGRGFTKDMNYGNRGGRIDTLQTDDEIIAQNYFLFGQIETELPANWLLTVGGSYNRLRYRFVRLSDIPADSLQTRRFDPVFSPRLALLKTFNDQFAAHASISYGFSPPSVTEFRPSEGSFNTELDPEVGINYEAGIRGSTLKGRLNFDLVAYFLQLRQTIVRRTVAGGAEYFVNAGSTDQRGLELAASWLVINQPKAILYQLKLWSTYTYNNYRFQNYQQNDTDFSGNRLPGIAPNIAIIGIDALSRPGLYANITFNFTDFIPLNDANTVYANDYALLGGRAGFRRTFAEKIQVDVFGGVDNALNQQYSLGNDINAFGGRFFNPAAPINFFSGLSVRYRL